MHKTSKLNALDMELTRSWRMYSIRGWLRSYREREFVIFVPGYKEINLVV